MSKWLTVRKDDLERLRQTGLIDDDCLVIEDGTWDDGSTRYGAYIPDEYNRERAFRKVYGSDPELYTNPGIKQYLLKSDVISCFDNLIDDLLELRNSFKIGSPDWNRYDNRICTLTDALCEIGYMRCYTFKDDSKQT